MSNEKITILVVYRAGEHDDERLLPLGIGAYPKGEDVSLEPVLGEREWWGDDRVAFSVHELTLGEYHTINHSPDDPHHFATLRKVVRLLIEEIHRRSIELIRDNQIDTLRSCHQELECMAGDFHRAIETGDTVGLMRLRARAESLLGGHGDDRRGISGETTSD